MTTSEIQIFYLAAFDVKGELVGQSTFEVARLSPKWLQLCERLLVSNSERFAVNLTGPFARIAIRFTSASGAAIGTLSVNGNLANSLLLISGTVPDADREVTELFHHSVSAMIAKLNPYSLLIPFQELLKLKNRPLVCVVPWGDANVSEEDNELVREISWHLAGAFFMQGVWRQS
jgi:hypothetical protein